MESGGFSRGSCVGKPDCLRLYVDVEKALVKVLRQILKAVRQIQLFNYLCKILLVGIAETRHQVSLVRGAKFAVRICKDFVDPMSEEHQRVTVDLTLSYRVSVISQHCFKVADDKFHRVEHIAITIIIRLRQRRHVQRGQCAALAIQLGLVAHRTTVGGQIGRHRYGNEVTHIAGCALQRQGIAALHQINLREAFLGNQLRTIPRFILRGGEIRPGAGSDTAGAAVLPPPPPQASNPLASKRMERGFAKVNTEDVCLENSPAPWNPRRDESAIEYAPCIICFQNC